MEAMEAMGGEAPPCYCWATHSGAELDLLIVRGRRRRGFEIKRTVAPRVTGSMRSALQVLRLDSLHVIRTGQATFPLAERIRAVSVTGLLNEIEPLAPGPGTPPTLRLAPALASRRSNRRNMQDAVSLAELRKARNMSQAELASAVGVSQATISRFEKGENTLTLRAIAKMARLFDCSLRDFMSGDQLLEVSALLGDEFYAFCPNPFCSDNETGLPDGQPTVWWKSGRLYPSERFDEINFCASCGTELVKECPRCERGIVRDARFCIACGQQLTEHPTEVDFKRIKDMHEVDDDIPF